MTVTTWQHIPDNIDDQLSIPTNNNNPHETINRVVGGTLTNVGGQVQEMGSAQRVTEADIAPTSGGILGTARNNGGFPTANVRPDSTVEIPGFGRTSAKVAAQLGYLTRNADGSFSEVSPSGKSEGLPATGNQESPNNSAQQQQQQDDGSAELFDPEIEEAYEDMIRDIPEGSYNSLMGGVVSLATRGDDIDSITAHLAPRIAAVTGKELDEVETNIEVASIAWQQQADDAVKAAGADPSEFFRWAKEHRRDELKNAVNHHLLARSTKAYREMVNDYFNHTLPTISALTKAGIPTKTSGRETLVKLKGHWMSLASAVKAGFV